MYTILKQYLGTHSRRLAKDVAAEEEEKGLPDREAIMAYHRTLGGHEQANDLQTDEDLPEADERVHTTTVIIISLLITFF